MNAEQYNELLEDTQDKVQEYVYSMDELRDFNTEEMISNIKKLWKHRGNTERTIDKSQIKDMLDEINTIDSVAKDCGQLEDLLSSDITDFGRVEQQ
tara:strand:- start:791 stop:1078 length:288 start_codon:yes stop_codon:yes gene_type:complete